MRRFTIGSAIVVALLLMLTAIATAAPPDCEELPFEHPHYCGLPCDELDPSDPNWCETPPTTTTTTTTTVPPALDPCPSGTFDVPSVPGWTTFGCDWILPTNEPGLVADGVITVDLPDEFEDIGNLTVTVRDSSPGDICELTWDGKLPEEDWEWYIGPLTNAGLELTVPLQNDDGHTYWDFDYINNDGQLVEGSSGEHWCGQYDPIEGLRTELNGDPLHLQLTMRAPKGTVVKVTLNPVLIPPEEEGS